MNGMTVVRSLLRIALVLACAAAGMATRADAQQGSTSESIQALLGDSTHYREAIAAFQKAVRAHDAAAVAALVSYPIKVTIGGSKRTIKAPQAFIAKYDSIMTPEIVAAVADEPWDSLMVSYRGVMLGAGEIWFNGICRDTNCRSADVKVITIQSGPARAPAVPGGKP